MGKTLAVIGILVGIVLTEVVEMCREHMPLATQVRLVVDPRLMRRVIAG